MVIDTPLVAAGSFYTRTGDTILETSQHKSGLWYRKEIADLLSIREALNNYKNVSVVNRVVMDIGANVGGFSHLALSNGASKVYSYEPEPHTYAMLAKNVGNHPRSNIFNRAITMLDQREVSFYVGYGNGAPSLASTAKRAGRRSIRVTNEHFANLVAEIQPQTIKIDIEGGEYELMLHIPVSCDELTIEWHGDTPDRMTEFKKLYPMFMEQGWKIVNEKKRESFVKDSLRRGKTPKWCIDAHYRR